LAMPFAEIFMRLGAPARWRTRREPAPAGSFRTGALPRVLWISVSRNTGAPSRLTRAVPDPHGILHRALPRALRFSSFRMTSPHQRLTRTGLGLKDVLHGSAAPCIKFSELSEGLGHLRAGNGTFLDSHGFRTGALPRVLRFQGSRKDWATFVPETVHSLIHTAFARERCPVYCVFGLSEGLGHFRAGNGAGIDSHGFSHGSAAPCIAFSGLSE
jgi:hypothetical protein